MAKNMAVYEVVPLNYGKVSLTLKEKIKERQITRNKLSKLSNTTYNVITRYCNNEAARVDLDVLARICHVLDCEVSDILKYEKPV